MVAHGAAAGRDVAVVGVCATGRRLASGGGAGVYVLSAVGARGARAAARRPNPLVVIIAAVPADVQALGKFIGAGRLEARKDEFLDILPSVVSGMLLSRSRAR